MIRKNSQGYNDPMDPYNAMDNRIWTFGAREKVLLAVTIILLIVISVKSIYFDPYEPLVSEDLTETNVFIGEQYDGFLYDSNLLKVRVIAFQETEEETRLHLRKYFLGLFPIGDVFTGF
jgi:hypothetical protein